MTMAAELVPDAKDVRMGRAENRGFTLIEILTVIGIIVVLAALIFPVFARAREQGNRTVCQGNLRQLALGLQLYVQDYDGAYPGDAGSSVGWQNLVLAYVKDRTVFRCPTLGH